MENKQLEVLKEYFDVALYGNLYPDVVSSGGELWTHFIKHGVVEGRVFSRIVSPGDVIEKYGAYTLSSITTYLVDVVEAERSCSESEFTFMRKFGAGHNECLSCREIIKRADVNFLNSVIAQYQPVDVIRFACERLNELKFNLNSDLDVRAYLFMYPDVSEASANAFFHYYAAGRHEGRRSRMPISIGKAAQFMRAISAGQREGGQEIFLLHDYVNLRLKQLRGNDVVISVSHDNPFESLGGIQQVVLKEFDAFMEEGNSSLHIFPQVSKSGFEDTGDEDVAIGVVLNGELLGFTPIGVFINVLNNLKLVIKELRIHHIFGFNKYSLKLLFGINCVKKTYILHDHSFLCDGYHLLRNGLEYCGAPKLNSVSCSFCIFGMSRKNRSGHLDEFVNAGFSLVAPSNSIAEIANRHNPNITRKLNVVPHWSFLHEKVYKLVKVNKVNVAYCGFPAYHKGYDIFLDCFYSDIQKKDFNFFHFGAERSHDLPSGIKYVEVKSSDLMGMSFKTELIRRDIHIAILPSRCPEAFGFIAHEASAAGCILLLSDSPVQPVSYVKEGEGVMSCNLENMAEMLNKLASDIKENGFMRKTLQVKFQCFHPKDN